MLLETNGSIDIHSVDSECHKIIDVKMPTSGESKKNYLKNMSLIQEKDELKFVIGGREDYLYAKNMLNLVPKAMLDKIVINVSPLYARMDPRILAEWILSDHLNVRLNMQLHKIIWPAEMRGV